METKNMDAVCEERKKDLHAWKLYRAHRAAIRERAANRKKKNETEGRENILQMEEKNFPWRQRWFNVWDTSVKEAPSNDAEMFLPMKHKNFKDDLGNSCGQLESGRRLARSRFNLTPSSVLKETGNTIHKPEGGIGGSEGVVTRAKARSFYTDVENRSNHQLLSGRKWPQKAPDQVQTATEQQPLSSWGLRSRPMTPMSRRGKIVTQRCMSSQKKGTPDMFVQTPYLTRLARSREQNVNHTTDRTWKTTKEEEGQMCSRALQFDSTKQEEVREEDFTEPLLRMNMTPILSKASVLKAPFNEKQEQAKENNERVIKETLPQPGMSRLQMIVQALNINIPLTNNKGKQMGSTTPAANTGQKVAGGNNNLHRMIKNDPPSASRNVTRKIHQPRLCYSSCKKRSAKKSKPTKIVARRSLIPSYSQVPSARNPRNPITKGTSKIPNHSSNTQTAASRSAGKRKIVTHQRASSRSMQRQSLAPIPLHLPESKPRQKNVEVCNTIPEESEKSEDKTEDKVEVPTKVDAATNTMIQFARCSTSPNLQIKDDVKKIVEQMEEIEKEAKLVQERTQARREEMREAGLLQSLTTTSSPLKRLRVWMKGWKEQNNTCSKDMASDDIESQSPTSKEKTKTDGVEEGEEEEKEKLGHDTSVAQSGDNDSLTFHTPNVSMEECSSLNTTYNPNQTILNTTSGLNTSQMHWSQLKCDYRFLQTPSNVKPKRRCLQSSVREEEGKDDEIFQSSHSGADGQSPFTQMVGDCERPSIAPMTPHSRQHISQLKLSLKNQLDALYD